MVYPHQQTTRHIIQLRDFEEFLKTQGIDCEYQSVSCARLFRCVLELDMNDETSPANARITCRYNLKPERLVRHFKFSGKIVDVAVCAAQSCVAVSMEL